MNYYMVFDVESIGLHGEGFAVGYSAVCLNGREVEAGQFTCPMIEASGATEDRNWVLGNVKTNVPDMPSPRAVREAFWAKWIDWQNQGATLWSDCIWPVESNFLSACIRDNPERIGEGPYPCYDVMTARLMAGFDPLLTNERLPGELPAHNPLADARQSARLLVEAMNKLRPAGKDDDGSHDKY